MINFLPLKSAFGRDTIALDIAHNYAGMAWSWLGVQKVLATLRSLHLAYHGPLLNLLPQGVSRVATHAFQGNGRMAPAQRLAMRVFSPR